MEITENQHSRNETFEKVRSNLMSNKILETTLILMLFLVFVGFGYFSAKRTTLRNNCTFLCLMFLIASLFILLHLC